MDENKKFILTSLDDENSKSIAEVLGNKTCKKIIDYLSERREASEKDISDDLNIPMNTAEYNLKKLIKSGLVKKTGNFFWSVKGRKISMYKLANKHIVISPGRKSPDLNILKTLLPVLVAVAFVAILVGIYSISDDPTTSSFNENINQFSSQEELNGFIEANLGVRQTSSSGFWSDLGGMMKGGTDMVMVESATTGSSQNAAPAFATDSAGTDDFSTTNIQIEGVDEADIVKNDGNYIYVVSGGKVKIIDAYPAENMNVLSEINESAQQIFINEDKLIILKSDYEYLDYGEVGISSSPTDASIAVSSKTMVAADVACYGEGCRGGYNIQKTIVSIYDISDRENPILDNKFEAEGNYVNSRMIGDYVYTISSKYVNQNEIRPPVYIANGIVEETLAEDVYYWDYYDNSYVFTGIMAINVEDGEFNKEVFLTGSSRTVFVSQDNIYLTGQKSFNYKVYLEDMIEEVYEPLFDIMDKENEFNDIIDSDDSDYEKLGNLKNIINDYSMSLTGEIKSEFDKELIERLNDYEVEAQKQREKTIIHKINIDDEEINYKGAGEVPGRVLNQFSMDEYDSYFRIATTTSRSSGTGSLNHLYVLDEDLEIVGSVEDLAEGESIYSVRFMGKKAYIVTFKKIDPLFVIDLEDPENPSVLGYLKITGYSDYLHPYDENHVFGIGKETAGGDEQFSWYQGVKVSLFDVSDVANPIEKAKFEIGDRGTDSEALRDHKAVLFDKEKGILVLPISLNEIDESRYSENQEIPENAYGRKVWEGAFVLDINLDGISERGRITHNEEITSEYGPAEDEPAGAERIDNSGNIWTKQENGMWKIEEENLYGEWISTEYGTVYPTGNMGFDGTSWGNVLIDEQPGGINYNRYNRFPWENNIKRSLYMDDVLYTISEAKIKANELSSIDEINMIELGYGNNNYPEPTYYGEEIAV